LELVERQVVLFAASGNPQTWRRTPQAPGCAGSCEAPPGERRRHELLLFVAHLVQGFGQNLTDPVGSFRTHSDKKKAGLLTPAKSPKKRCMEGRQMERRSSNFQQAAGHSYPAIPYWSRRHFECVEEFRQSSSPAVGLAMNSYPRVGLAMNSCPKVGLATVPLPTNFCLAFSSAPREVLLETWRDRRVLDEDARRPRCLAPSCWNCSPSPHTAL